MKLDKNLSYFQKICALSLFFLSPSSYASIIYDWADPSGITTGNIILADQLDPENFSDISISGFFFNFSQGRTITLDDIQDLTFGLPKVNATMGVITNFYAIESNDFLTSSGQLIFLTTHAEFNSTFDHPTTPPESNFPIREEAVGEWIIRAPAPVPIPAAFWLFSSALVGLYGLSSGFLQKN